MLFLYLHFLGLRCVPALVVVRLLKDLYSLIAPRWLPDCSSMTPSIVVLYVSLLQLRLQLQYPSSLPHLRLLPVQVE